VSHTIFYMAVVLFEAVLVKVAVRMLYIIIISRSRHTFSLVYSTVSCSTACRQSKQIMDVKVIGIMTSSLVLLKKV